MTEPTLEGFVEFVREQDGDRKINHDDGWCGCAVGDYVKGGREEAFNFAVSVLLRECYKVYELLDDYKENIEIETYSDLQALLTEQGL